MDEVYANYNERELVFREYFHSQYKLEGEPIIHPETDTPGGGQQVVLDKGLYRCRYCGSKKSDGVGFKKAHVIPEHMGNKLIVSHAECTPCNETFSEYEAHLGQLIGPLKTLLGVKGKSKGGRRIPKFKDFKFDTSITRSDTGVLWEIDPQQTTVRLDGPRDISIGVRHIPYVPLSAWKGLARSSVHLLKLEELDHFQWFREAVHKEVHNEQIEKSAGIACAISTFLPSMHNMFERPELSLFKRRADSIYAVEGSIQPARMFVVKAASHIYQIPVFSDQDMHCMYENTESGNAGAEKRGIPIYPVLVPRDFADRYDLPKRSMLKLNSREKERPINWIQIHHSGPQPLTDEQMQEAGLSSEEIAQMKSDGLTGETALEWLQSLAAPRDAES